jgi:hypothetical protein
MAAGAATIYRNYFVPIQGGPGQTQHRQIDCLQDIGMALGNEDGSLWQMRNGYALCSESSLARIERQLAAIAPPDRSALRDKLRIGLHRNVEVTDAPGATQRVSQAFCSALPVNYTDVPQVKWQSFATLVLEGAYEATLWAAALNAAEGFSTKLFLTRVGGGAFGNHQTWIDAAMRRAFDKIRNLVLDVFIVSRSS